MIELGWQTNIWWNRNHFDQEKGRNVTEQEITSCACPVSMYKNTDVPTDCHFVIRIILQHSLFHLMTGMFFNAYKTQITKKYDTV